jgi:hypothetical protein
MTTEDELREVTLTLCQQCLTGAGGECHTPGCALWMNRAPDVPLTITDDQRGGFYMSILCDECNEDILMGPCLTTIERDGLPIIPFDFAAQETFTCDCGAQYATGDFDYMSAEDL